MSSKRTPRRTRAGAEAPAAAPAATADAGRADEESLSPSADDADEDVERLEGSLDALGAEVGAEPLDEESASAFDMDPAGGLGAPLEDDADESEDVLAGIEPDAVAGAPVADEGAAAAAGFEAVGAADADASVEEEGAEAIAAEEDDDEEDDDDDAGDVVIFDADAEDREEELARRAAELKVAPGGKPRELAELVAVCEALIFVSEEPMTTKVIADVLGEDKGWVQVAVEQLAAEFNERNGGLMLREVAGGWQIATRPEHHEHIRAYLKSRPSAKLSLAALETLAVIAYKQPVTVPEILEIRGVQSSSAIKTLLDKRLIIAKGRKEVVGRPMMYGTSKEFLLQFGLRDLSELPSIEDFEDLATGES
jgi:segregation and condensation protein B